MLITNLIQKQQSLIGDLNLIADPHERLSVLVSRAIGHKLPEDQKTDPHRVHGCISRVWLVANMENGLCTFRCDADSPLVKGLVALLCDLYTGAIPEDVIRVDPEVIEKCGLDRLLSPTRLNGLRSVRARIRDLAMLMQSSRTAAE